jgi:hypothetical protein
MDTAITFTNYEVLENNPEYIILYNNCCTVDRHLVIKSSISSITIRRTHSYYYILLSIIGILLFPLDGGLFAILGGVMLLIQIFMFCRKRLIVVSGINTFEANLKEPMNFLRWFTDIDIPEEPMKQFK